MLYNLTVAPQLVASASDRDVLVTFSIGVVTGNCLMAYLCNAMNGGEFAVIRTTGTSIFEIVLGKGQVVYAYTNVNTAILCVMLDEV